MQLISLTMDLVAQSYMTGIANLSRVKRALALAQVAAHSPVLSIALWHVCD